MTEDERSAEWKCSPLTMTVRILWGLRQSQLLPVVKGAKLSIPSLWTSSSPSSLCLLFHDTRPKACNLWTKAYSKSSDRTCTYHSTAGTELTEAREQKHESSQGSPHGMRGRWPAVQHPSALVPEESWPSVSHTRGQHLQNDMCTDSCDSAGWAISLWRH